MSRKVAAVAKLSKVFDVYSQFDQLDGRHPWMKVVPKGSVTYQVRMLNFGTISYFNYGLAKEMGLIDSDHPHRMNKPLEIKLLKTFSIKIINEYDHQNGVEYDPQTIKPHRYMATRYLQMQHPSKKGRTSGDGRCVWNGVVEHQGQTWDVSSRGTGVTSLAPGSVLAKKPLRTGNTEFGYGCGLAEMDELIASVIQAEIMHLQGLKTERVLCVIDLGEGFGIGVRAAPTLLRPAHLFLYLKQNRRTELKIALDFLIDRQVANKQWIKNWGADLQKKYQVVLENVVRDFAQFAAVLEVEYIFTWLDWDGDNVLAGAGIIDYGSVRQFGLRHDQYRYDDIDRFSTNLSEQKEKAKLMVQVFAQLIHYVRTKRKKPLKDFSSLEVIRQFDLIFEKKRQDRLLYKMGFSEVQRRKLLSWHKESVLQFEKDFLYFEKVKASGGVKKLADGINQPALFNLQNVLRELPVLLNLSPHPEKDLLSDEEMFELMLSQNLRPKDRLLRNRYRPYLKSFQKNYLKLVSEVSASFLLKDTLSELAACSARTCRPDRMTGNALIQMVDDIITTAKKESYKPDRLQKIIDRVIDHQGPLPGYETPFRKEPVSLLSYKGSDLELRLYDLLVQNREDI